jgi:hypothetical protein
MARSPRSGPPCSGPAPRPFALALLFAFGGGGGPASRTTVMRSRDGRIDLDRDLNVSARAYFNLLDRHCPESSSPAAGGLGIPSDLTSEAIRGRIGGSRFPLSAIVEVRRQEGQPRHLQGRLQGNRKLRSVRLDRRVRPA